LADIVIIPLPGIGTLALDRDAYEAALAAGASLVRPATSSRTTNADGLLTAEQVAERLSLPQSWIEEATRQGRLPCHEFGRYKRYSLPAVIDAAKHARRNGLDYEP
jgi:excisionase family DNA binding protein